MQVGPVLHSITSWFLLVIRIVLCCIFIISSCKYFLCPEQLWMFFFHGGVPRGRDACHAGDAEGSSVAVASSSYQSDIGSLA